mgnify:CR=1 FL=1
MSDVGGYTCDAAACANGVQTHKFVDMSTRLVVLEAVIYNPGLELVGVVRMAVRVFVAERPGTFSFSPHCGVAWSATDPTLLVADSCVCVCMLMLVVPFLSLQVEFMASGRVATTVRNEVLTLFPSEMDNYVWFSVAEVRVLGVPRLGKHRLQCL